MYEKIEQPWEDLIAERMAMHATTKICRQSDARKRNAANATKKWREKNKERYDQKKREWLERNPDKVKIYQERNKKNVKRWAEEHPERIRELNRKSEEKRKNNPARKAWEKEYRARPEVRERNRERDRLRNRTPERKAWEREYRRKRREALKMRKVEAA